jgi:hypothetical protein
MSGKPNRYPSDSTKYKGQYMEALELRANIDDMNLQANKTYKATGQLPPVSQMPETRTTSEILADNERLKIELIKDLAPVGDSHFAQAVIQRIQNSPLNTTGSLFTYFAQRAPEIVIQLKKLYKYKIKGDSNDVETIEDMFSKTKAMTTSVSTFFSQSESNKIKLNNIRDYSEIQRLFEDIGRRLSLKAPPTSPLGRAIKYISRTLVLYTTFLEYNEMFDYTIDLVSKDPDRFNVVNGRNILNEFYDAFKRYNEILEEFPKADTLYALLQQLDLTIKNDNMDLTVRLLTEFQSLVNKVNEIDKLLKDLKRLKTLLDTVVLHEVAELGDDDDANVGEREDDDVEDVPLAPTPANNQEDIIPPPSAPENTDSSQLSIETYISDLKYKINELEENVKKNKKTFDHINSHTELIHHKLDNKDYNSETEKNKLINYIEKSIKSMTALRSSILFTETTINQMNKDLEEKQAELKKMSGNGIMKRRGRPRGCGIVKQKPYSESVKAHVSYDKGIMESPRFVKFGKYLINNHKLNNDDIFALKQPSGGALQEFPSVRLSKHLSNVIKKMVGGGVPSYNDLNGLSEPEKAYLHKVSTRSNIVDKFSIPAPSKDQYEKDIHEFEVLKGEIMAGNDSKELIKKFKLHLMKLSKMGSLPKREVSEVMEELLQINSKLYYYYITKCQQQEYIIITLR